MTTKIIVADDHHVMRKACVKSLQLRPDFEVCGQAANGEEALRALKFYHPDILLLDLNMPVMDGFQVLEILQKEKSEVKTIVVSMNDHPSKIYRSMELGARGFLSSCNEVDEEENAIDSVMQTGYYFNTQTNLALLKDITRLKKFEPHFDDIIIHFDDMEMKVLCGFCNQFTAKEIGDQLYTSQKTVERIKLEMINKLKAKNFMSVVIYAHQKGYIDLDNISVQSKSTADKQVATSY